MISDLYGDEYNHGLCVDIVGGDFTAMSTGCQAYFDAENCFYECDKNVGKWRKHSDCNEEDADVSNHNAWQIEAMPIRASTADAMYEACKDDFFPDSKGMWGTEAGNWADAWSTRVNVNARWCKYRYWNVQERLGNLDKRPRYGRERVGYCV